MGHPRCKNLVHEQYFVSVSFFSNAISVPQTQLKVIPSDCCTLAKRHGGKSTMPEEVKNCKKLIIYVQKRVKQFRFIEQILVLESFKLSLKSP